MWRRRLYNWLSWYRVGSFTFFMLITIGWAVMGWAHPSFTVVKICIVASVGVLLLKTALQCFYGWKPRNHRTPKRLVVFVTSLVALGLVFLSAWNWIGRKEAFYLSTILNPEKIGVYLVDAFQYGYRGATKEPPENRNREITEPIHIPYKTDAEVPFAFGVRNQNWRVPLEHAMLRVDFGQNKVSVRITGNNQGNVSHWQEAERGRTYWCLFDSVGITPRHSWDHLYVKFPRPGFYVFKFTITGDGLKRGLQFPALVNVYVSQSPAGAASSPEMPPVASGSYALPPGYSHR